VSKAYIDPNLYIQWLGPRRLKMNIEKFGPTNGSSWRYVHHDEDGNGVSAHDQVLLGERLVFLMDVFKVAVSNKDQND